MIFPINDSDAFNLPFLEVRAADIDVGLRSPLSASLLQGGRNLPKIRLGFAHALSPTNLRGDLCTFHVSLCLAGSSR